SGSLFGVRGCIPALQTALGRAVAIVVENSGEKDRRNVLLAQYTTQTKPTALRRRLPDDLCDAAIAFGIRTRTEPARRCTAQRRPERTGLPLSRAPRTVRPLRTGVDPLVGAPRPAGSGAVALPETDDRRAAGSDLRRETPRQLAALRAAKPRAGTGQGAEGPQARRQPRQAAARRRPAGGRHAARRRQRGSPSWGL